MAKIRNKIAGNRLKKQAIKQVNTFKNLKGDMQVLIEAEDYVAAMDVMAEIAANSKIDAEVMYWGALCYFHTGDYDRAARWINNALNYNSNGVKERILLSAICIAEGRYEDGIRVMEAVLSGGMDNIAASDRAFMMEVLAPVRYGYEDILARYPQTEAMLKDKSEIAGEQEAEESAATALAKLREMLGRKKAGGKAELSVEEENKPSVVAQETFVDGNIDLTESKCPADKKFDVNDTIQQIMGKKASLQEKIKLLNAFAGGCYQSDDCQAACKLLEKALELDACAPEILKNMAYVCLADGDKEKAMEFVSRMPMVDFGLLYAMKQS